MTNASRTSGPRVGIIGAGAAGLASAMFATDLGAPAVTVFDIGYPGQGSSARSAGIFNRQTIREEDLRMRAFTVRQLEQFEADGDLHLYRTGYVRVARTADQIQSFERARDLLVSEGVPSEVIDADRLAALVPGMRCDDFVGGLYGVADGHMDGSMLCAAYQKRAVARGAVVRTKVGVVGAEHSGYGVSLHLSDGTSQDFDVVINAAGPNASAVAALLGVEQRIINDLHKIVIVRFEDRPERHIPCVQTHVPGFGESLYLRPEGPGQMLVGLHSTSAKAEESNTNPFSFDEQPDEGYIDEVVTRLVDRLDWDDFSLAGGWTGLYPNTPDGRFQVGAYESQPRIVAAGGLGGVGLSVSAAVGALAAEWAVLGRPRRFDFADALRPDRPSLTMTEA